MDQEESAPLNLFENCRVFNISKHKKVPKDVIFATMSKDYLMFINGKSLVQIYDLNMKFLQEYSFGYQDLTSKIFTFKIIGNDIFFITNPKKRSLKLLGGIRSSYRFTSVYEFCYDISKKDITFSKHHKEVEHRLLDVHEYNKELFLIYKNGKIHHYKDPKDKSKYVEYKFDSDLDDVCLAGEKVLFKRVRKNPPKYSHSIFNCKTKEFRDLNIPIDIDVGCCLRGEAYIANYRKGKILPIETHKRTIYPGFKVEGVIDMKFFGKYLVVQLEESINVYQRNGILISKFKIQKQDNVELSDDPFTVIINDYIYFIELSKGIVHSYEMRDVHFSFK